MGAPGCIGDWFTRLFPAALLHLKQKENQTEENSRRDFRVESRAVEIVRIGVSLADSPNRRSLLAEVASARAAAKALV